MCICDSALLQPNMYLRLNHCASGRSLFHTVSEILYVGIYAALLFCKKKKKKKKVTVAKVQFHKTRCRFERHASDIGIRVVGVILNAASSEIERHFSSAFPDRNTTLTPTLHHTERRISHTNSTSHIYLECWIGRPVGIFVYNWKMFNLFLLPLNLESWIV